MDRRPSGYFGFAKTDDYQCRYTFRPLDADKGVVMAMNVVYANKLGESGQDIVLPGCPSSVSTVVFFGPSIAHLSYNSNSLYTML